MTVKRLSLLLPGLALGLFAQERPADPQEELTASARSGDRSRLRERANLLRDRIRSNPAAARKFLLSDRDAARLRTLDPTAPLEVFDTGGWRPLFSHRLRDVYVKTVFDGWFSMHTVPTPTLGDRFGGRSLTPRPITTSISTKVPPIVSGTTPTSVS